MREACRSYAAEHVTTASTSAEDHDFFGDVLKNKGLNHSQAPRERGRHAFTPALGYGLMTVSVYE